MEHVYDVAVIGAGCAGVSAVLAAARTGARTALLGAAPGASALCGGGWHGAPPAALLAALEAAGLPVQPAPAPLAHPYGELRRYEYAALSHLAATAGDGTLVLGIAGLPGFRATALARLWGDATGSTLHAATVTLARTPPAGWAPASLAGALERDPELLAGPLAIEARRVGAKSVIVPAVLGSTGWAAVHAAVEQAAGVPVGEATGCAPSLPGVRLDRALLAAAGAARASHIRGRVTDRFTGNGRLDAVAVAVADRHVNVTARAWVLATGRFVGGGITADPGWTETALGVPLTLEHLGVTFNSIEPLDHSAADRNTHQPWLHVGVHCNADQRPQTPAGDALFDNLFAAGAVLTGAPPGLGASAASGWRAGELAARAAGATGASGAAGAAGATGATDIAGATDAASATDKAGATGAAGSGAAGTHAADRSADR